MERSFSIDINNLEKNMTHYLPDKAGQVNALLKERKVLQVLFWPRSPEIYSIQIRCAEVFLQHASPRISRPIRRVT